jgi:hypothetical protein
VTVIVRVEVLNTAGVDVTLITGVGGVDELVEIGTADITLLLIDIAGLEENR